MGGMSRIAVDCWELCRVGMDWELCRVGMGIGSCVG